MLAALFSTLQAEPVAIFDGESLDGWRIQDGAYWTAKDGVLTGESDERKLNSILWTEKSYRDFTLSLEFLFRGDIDSGIFLRHVDDQIQIGTSRSLRRDMTGSPYIGSKGRYTAEAEGVAELLKEGEWNRMTVTARGPRYLVTLNGQEVLDYDSDTALEEGPIGLQVHSGMEMRIDFRNLTLEELAADTP